jgi:hypothetical protein
VINVDGLYAVQIKNEAVEPVKLLTELCLAINRDRTGSVEVVRSGSDVKRVGVCR